MEEYIDLEHNVCYSPANHWNGLTDGKWKYLYHAQNGEEQLFDLVKDPDELEDLAGVGSYTGQLKLWRGAGYGLGEGRKIGGEVERDEFVAALSGVRGEGRGERRLGHVFACPKL
jgi:hypothetical protein